ncbi:hypothetical protein E1292_15900 [Nonomuraea deserti]|uniref:Uncharacterized protein n=1 Tax=Nonomuraea deserti TaxID=1848322 RepID=A0A4R4VSE1_9ACTN|nr:hypothetical protein [Nonomuraea deserti]TDD06153.1 hypothetical protein E1292_15900 [Nonomuraea deserti]
MSDGFKIPIPGGTPSPWQPGDEGGDLRNVQYLTLAMLVFSAYVFPHLEKAVLSYGLTVPTDPQLVHRSADGWSSFGGGVHAAGRTAQQQHDSVAQASWQAPERDLYEQRMDSYVLASDTASDSAQTLSTILRWVANIQTASIYLGLLSAAAIAATAAKSLLMGPGGRLYGHLVAKSAAASIEGRVRQLQRFLATAAVSVGLAAAGAVTAEFTLTDGLKLSYGAGRPEGGSTADV